MYGRDVDKGIVYVATDGIGKAWQELRAPNPGSRVTSVSYSSFLGKFIYIYERRYSGTSVGDSQFWISEAIK